MKNETAMKNKRVLLGQWLKLRNRRSALFIVLSCISGVTVSCTSGERLDAADTEFGVVATGGGGSDRLSVSAVSASHDDGNVPQNTLDGSLATRWSALGHGQYITFDLGSSKVVGNIKVAWYKGNQRVADFKIRVGNSTASLTTVFDGSSSGNTLNLETYNFTDVEARYVRITGFGNTSNNWNSITEVELYGADGGGGGGYPSSLLDLSVWELTLPIPESYDPDNPKDVYQPELETYQHDTYFHLNDAATAVVFRAHAGGTTTPNSSYPRSELREMERGYSGTKPKASWSTNSGTHTMYIKQAITHLPDVKRHVVAGQIHDSSDDVIVFRLENKKLFLELDGKDGPTLTSNYNLGDVFEVKFVAHDGVIDVYYNDMNNVFWTYSASAANTSGCYFKAGCYTQSNPSRGDAPSAYGEVEIYDLWVSHQ
ncbi:MAG: polysaccharide lyase family 7 protein [Proteobacteria bacterium]|nr:polysaccharide lyase family 7 protein [Pseudomonadota bacterium]